MSKGSGFPRWFYPYEVGKPQPPVRPVEPGCSRFVREDVKVVEFKSFVECEVVGLVGELSGCGATHYEFSYDEGYDDVVENCRLVLYNLVEVPNSSYDSELKLYRKSLVKYEEDLKEFEFRSKEWVVLKEKWDGERRRKEEVRERKLFERLRRKFG